MQDDSMTPQTQIRLMKEFPQINTDVAKEIDIKIKTKILAYESDTVNRDISEGIQKEIKKYTKTKNVKKVKNKCNKLASEYLENNRIWNLQENWYCLLAYFITIATMILRCIDVKTKTNDWISLAMYFAVSGLWIIIVKTKRFMGLKAESFLIAFNNNAPFLTIVSSLFFYTVVCTCTCRYIWIAVIVLTFFGCMSLTYLWYKREKIYMHI